MTRNECTWVVAPDLTAYEMRCTRNKVNPLGGGARWCKSVRELKGVKRENIALARGWQYHRDFRKIYHLVWALERRPAE